VRSSEEIVELYHQRRIAAGPVHEQMRRVRDLANGDVIVPLNELRPQRQNKRSEPTRTRIRSNVDACRINDAIPIFPTGKRRVGER
jgi:hypothetical protein